MQRLLDGRAEHVIRRVGKVSFKAFVRRTGKVVSTGALDSVCAKKLRALRDELSEGA